MNPSAPTALYSTADLDTYINTARGQLAGESESVRYLGTISTVINQRAYNFSSINTGVSATNGISGIINVRSIKYAIGSGYRWLKPVAWPWFDMFLYSNPTPVSGPPRTWSQYGQGSAPGATGAGAGGSFYIDPPPDTIYTLLVDSVCYPIALVDDTTVEALPYLFTDAVPYFASYLALMGSQTGQRQAEAARLFDLYQTFVGRARQAANPSITTGIWQGGPDPTAISKLGMQQQAGGG
jgi:hypothetical protein